MVVAAILDEQGHPLCCELWPGNTTNVTTLVPIVDRLKSRFAIRPVCLAADRGMISRKTIERFESRQMGYIPGARMRNQKEVREQVLSRGGRRRSMI